MKAISTKYLPATNFRGSRIKAFTEGGNQITISYPHELNAENGHLAAAVALKTKMNWSGKLIGGGTGNGYVFVFTDSEPREE